MTYSEKLKDPRWQKRRLEIFKLYDFKCNYCKSDKKTLNVHHLIYRKNTDVWDYADIELMCLCEDCHKEESIWKEHINEVLSSLNRHGFPNEMIFSYLMGAHDSNIIDKSILNWPISYLLSNHEEQKGLIERAKIQSDKDMEEFIVTVKNSK